MTHVLCLLSVVVLRCDSVRPTIEENDDAQSNVLANNGTAVTASGHLQSHKRKQSQSGTTDNRPNKDPNKKKGNRFSFSLPTRKAKNVEPKHPPPYDSTGELTAEAHSTGEHDGLSHVVRSKEHIEPVRPPDSESTGDLTGELSDASVHEELTKVQPKLAQEDSKREAIAIKGEFNDEKDDRELKLYRLVDQPDGGEPEGEFLRGHPDITSLDVEWEHKMPWNYYFAGRELNPKKEGWVEVYLRNQKEPEKIEKFYIRKKIDPIHDIVELVDEDDDERRNHHPPHDFHVEENDLDNGVRTAETPLDPEEAARKRHREGNSALPRYRNRKYNLKHPALDRYIGEAADKTNIPYEPVPPGGEAQHFKEYEEAHKTGLMPQANIFVGHSERLKEAAEDAAANIHNLRESVDSAKKTLTDFDFRMEDVSDQVKKEYKSYQEKSRSAFDVANKMLGSPRELASKVDEHWKDDHLDDEELIKHGQKYLDNGDLNLFKDEAYPSQWRWLEFLQEVPKPDSWRPPGSSSSVSEASGSRIDTDDHEEQFASPE